MSVEIINGNILEAKENIIGQQVNTMGIFNDVLNLQLNNKYPVVFNKYKELLENDNILVAHLNFHQPVIVNNKNQDDFDVKIISNLFAQNTIGNDGKHTDKLMLETALIDLMRFAKSKDLSVALPYDIGSNVGAGADIVAIHTIIDRVFVNYHVSLYKNET